MNQHVRRVYMYRLHKKPLPGPDSDQYYLDPNGAIYELQELLDSPDSSYYNTYYVAIHEDKLPNHKLTKYRLPKPKQSLVQRLKRWWYKALNTNSI